MESIAIAGFGAEGRALCEYFKGTAELHVFDEHEQLVPPGVSFHQSLLIPADFSIVYKSPGIPTYKLTLASSATRVSTMMDIVLKKVGPQAIGVTGTKGKSTVSSLIAHILKSSGRDAVLFGNIGIADLSLVQSPKPDTVFVVEMSSYQCEHITASPHCAVFTNFYPEHLNHHGSLASYEAAKRNIVRFQKMGDICINGSDLKLDTAGTVSKPDFTLSFKTKLSGEHNQRNCALAYAAVQTLGISDEEARAHIATFEPLPYRLETVGTFGGVTFIDDSLATIPEATLAAIQALPRVDTLILGGEDRGVPYDSFARALNTSAVATLIAFPETGPKMTAGISGKTIIAATSMEDAVRAAYAHTPKGGVVLLSNGSPSFNMFTDYKDKSAQFRRFITELAS